MPATREFSEQGWPENVGICAMEIYFPKTYVDQTELESYDGVSQGKYTIGLGQSRMGFCSDREDINSLCLTVVSKLMAKNGIDYERVGRLEVGTETIVDKSKSVKSVLMQLFASSGNTDVEGVDTTNACYGGTNALFNAVNWIESSSWDGRYALVVCGDIAVYASGAARPTGGAGAVAMLIGPKAPIVFDRGVRGTHMEHVYDFYKPDLSSEYPVVDGKLSIQCYLGALDKCYALYSKRASTFVTKDNGDGGGFTLRNADSVIFHAPFGKLVQKSFARMLLNDYLRYPNSVENSNDLEPFKDTKLEESYFNRDVEKAFMTASKALFEEKTRPSTLISNQVGNMYTSSVYGGLASFVSANTVESIANKRIVLFSYGSGLASSMFSLKVTSDATNADLTRLINNLADLKDRLDVRTKVEPAQFEAMMQLRETTHHLAPYTPTGSLDDINPATFYLSSIDELHRRYYDCKNSITTKPMC